MSMMFVSCNEASSLEDSILSEDPKCQSSPKLSSPEGSSKEGGRVELSGELDLECVSSSSVRLKKSTRQQGQALFLMSQLKIQLRWNTWVHFLFKEEETMSPSAYSVRQIAQVSWLKLVLLGVSVSLTFSSFWFDPSECAWHATSC